MSFNVKMAIEKAAELLIDVRGNTTTLEVKKYLRKQNWRVSQQEVSDIMDKMLGLTFTDNGTYRTYEYVTITPTVMKAKKIKKDKKISKSKMVDLMENAGGKFITVTFEKKNGDTRTMNCRVDTAQFMNSQGYINVHENGGSKGTRYRQVNPRTLLGLKINGKSYLRK